MPRSFSNTAALSSATIATALGYTPARATPQVNAQTGTTYTVLTTDNGKIITCSNAGAITVTVPASLGAGFNAMIVQIGAGQVTLVGSSATLNNANGLKTAAQYSVLSLISYATDVFVVAGDATA